MVTTFIQTAASAMIGIILILTIRGKNGEIALLLSIACCCIALFGVVQILTPVRDFIEALMITSQIDTDLIKNLMKILGIGLIGEITSSVCADSGNTAIGKTVQLAATAMILYLSLPLFTALLELVERIMGNL